MCGQISQIIQQILQQRQAQGANGQSPQIGGSSNGNPLGLTQIPGMFGGAPINIPQNTQQGASQLGGGSQPSMAMGAMPTSSTMGGLASSAQDSILKTMYGSPTGIH
jgi:hypothetical protein